MEATTVVMVLVIMLVLRLSYAILVFVNSFDANPKVFFFEG